MSKSTKVIAALGVVAGLGVAVAPLSAFAATRVDNLQVTVNTSCTVADDTDATASVLENDYTATLNAGAEATMTGPGASEKVMTVTCNDATGYHITATLTEALTHTDTTTIIAPGISGEYWSMKVTGAGNLAAANGYGSHKALTTGDTVLNNANQSAADGDSFTVEYKVGTNANTKAGVYSGTVTYTLVQGQ